MVVFYFIFIGIINNIYFNTMKKYLKYLLLSLILLIIGQSCYRKKEKFSSEKYFEKSYKNKKYNGEIKNAEHLDTVKNVYSNYYFNIGFDAPDNWNTDKGMNDHTIFRASQKDSGFTFMINVIEPKLSKKNKLNAWEKRIKYGKREFDKNIISVIENQSKSNVVNFEVKKVFLKNHTCIKMSFETLIKELDLEYINYNIMFQLAIENKNYTFGLSIPKMFYDLKPSYYENMFRNIYFLHNKEKTNNIINNGK